MLSENAVLFVKYFFQDNDIISELPSLVSKEKVNASYSPSLRSVLQVMDQVFSHNEILTLFLRNVFVLLFLEEDRN